MLHFESDLASNPSQDRQLFLVQYTLEAKYVYLNLKTRARATHHVHTEPEAKVLHSCLMLPGNQCFRVAECARAEYTITSSVARSINRAHEEGARS